jgi:hypothetical protein
VQDDESSGLYVIGNTKLYRFAELPCNLLAQVAMEQHTPHVVFGFKVKDSGYQGSADRDCWTERHRRSSERPMIESRT